MTPKDRLLRFVTHETLERDACPWCDLEWLARPGLTEADRLLLVRATMPVGKGHDFHLHPTNDEIIYVLEGVAEQWVDRDKALLHPGEIAHIPMGTVHATFNAGDVPLVFLAMVGPAKAEGDFVVDVFDQEPWASIRS